jgi:DNA helicase-2/ATP-dependent DNA helicase PcrA
MTEFRPRSGQKRVLGYTGGKMGISAVPGSGKTHTLAVLAAQLVAERIEEDQEVLVVTLVNSAVDNFKQRINRLMRQRQLLANFGYRVRTLHGLSHDIVRERPGLVSLSDDFAIVDDREATNVRQDAVDAWLRANPDAAEPFLASEVEGDQAEWVKANRWPSVAHSVAAAFIKRAKDKQLAPEVLLERLASRDLASIVPHKGMALWDARLTLARMGVEIYADYQRSLAYRGAVDFDDLIRLALQILGLAPDYLVRLQHRWPYILEDEAQDSSELQERVLHLLAGEEGNWVRVGDPNQAIYETFTNADPWYLRRFLARPDVTEVRLEESGRSQPAIIELANYLVDWTVNEHPVTEVRNAFLSQHIQPTTAGDPQPNPPLDRAAVQLVERDFTPEQELVAIADSLGRWMPDHPKQTVAVLVPRNQRGFAMIDMLKARGIPCHELLRSTSTTRATAGALGNLLRCLADPTSARKLAAVFQVWRREDRYDAAANARLEALTTLIRGCRAVEGYLWPRADFDWLAAQRQQLPAADFELLTEFRPMAQRWHRAATMPVDQLILTLAGDLFQRPEELALAHKLAALLRDVADAHPNYRLVELVEELAVIARNERRFLGFDIADTGFEPPPGEVTVATMHKAKGLEWDRVYLMSVNNYNFPSGQAHDTYISEQWFVRDRLNLEAEALAQLDLLAGSRAGSGSDQMASTPTQEARRAYISERLRLLYVGITRARRDLIITWNTGRRRSERLQPAVPFIALHEYWQEEA